MAEGGASGGYIMREFGPVEGLPGRFLWVFGDDVVDRFLFHD